MDCATVYDDDGYTITTGLQTCERSSEALRVAKSIAARRRETVLLEDSDGMWFVGPRGGVRKMTGKEYQAWSAGAAEENR